MKSLIFTFLLIGCFSELHAEKIAKMKDGSNANGFEGNQDDIPMLSIGSDGKPVIQNSSIIKSNQLPSDTPRSNVMNRVESNDLKRIKVKGFDVGMSVPDVLNMCRWKFDFQKSNVFDFVNKGIEVTFLFDVTQVDREVVKVGGVNFKPEMGLLCMDALNEYMEKEYNVEFTPYRDYPNIGKVVVGELDGALIAKMTSLSKIMDGAVIKLPISNVVNRFNAKLTQGVLDSLKNVSDDEIPSAIRRLEERLYEDKRLNALGVSFASESVEMRKHRIVEIEESLSEWKKRLIANNKAIDALKSKKGVPQNTVMSIDAACVSVSVSCNGGYFSFISGKLVSFKLNGDWVSRNFGVEDLSASEFAEKIEKNYGILLKYNASKVYNQFPGSFDDNSTWTGRLNSNSMISISADKTINVNQVEEKRAENFN